MNVVNSLPTIQGEQSVRRCDFNKLFSLQVTNGTQNKLLWKTCKSRVISSVCKESVKNRNDQCSVLELFNCEQSKFFPLPNMYY